MAVDHSVSLARSVAAAGEDGRRTTLVGDDPEAEPAHGLDAFQWELVIELAAQPRHVDVDHVVERRAAMQLLPHVAAQHLARHDLPRMIHQIREQLELTRREIQHHAATRGAAADQVELDVANLEASSRRLALTLT